MGRKRQRRDDRRRWWIFAFVALLLHVPFVGSFLFYLSGEEARPTNKAPVRLIGQRTQAVMPPEPEANIPEDAQIVEVDQPEEPDLKETVDTPYLADKTVRTERETKAVRQRNKRRARSKKTAQPQEPSAVQSERSDSLEKSTSQHQNEQLAKTPSREERPESEKGKQAKKSVIHGGESRSPLMPMASRADRLAAIQAMSGGGGPQEYLPEVQVEAAETILNANRYKFADFFYRVRERVRQHWRPASVYRSRDPSGRVYGVKDRYTVLKVTLDDDGNLRGVRTSRQSGLGFMDDEATQAFRRAGPFPNPPKGLLDDAGKVTFQFGFFFEISSGRSRFNWSRL